MAQLTKTVGGLAIASVKTVGGLAVASVKTIGGLDNTAAGGATATDTFNRADENPMSTTTMSDGVSTWTIGPGASDNPQILDNSFQRVSGFGMASVATPAFAANQKTTITIGTNTPVGQGACVRCQPASGSCYMLFVDATTTLLIYEVLDTGTLGFTQLGAAYTVSTLVAGDTISLEISGSTLTAYVNGVQTGTTRSDSTYSTGQPGCLQSQSGESIDTFTAVDV